MPISDQTPQVILISDDTSAIPLAVSGSIPANTPGILLAGIVNDTTASFLKLDSSGNLFITGSVTTIIPPINVSNPTVGATGSLAPISASLIAGVDSNGILRPFSTTTSGILNITGSTAIVGIPIITGSVTVSNLLTASVSIINIPTVTGSITIPNLVSTTNVSLVGNGALLPTTGSLVGGSDGTYFRFFSVDSIGRLTTVFAGIPGAAVPVSSSLVGGVDGSGNLQSLSVTSAGVLNITGSVQVVGIPTVTGSVTVANLLTASVAITNVATVTGSITVPNLLTASVSVTNIPTVTGSITVPNVVAVHGNNAENSSPVGNPIWIGGYDRNVIRAIRTDVSGKLVTTNIVLTGSTAPVSAALMGGKDPNNNLQAFNVTTSGVLVISSSYETPENGSAPAKIAVVGGVSGSTYHAINVNSSGSIYVNEEEVPTFSVMANDITIGNNKSMIALFNSGSSNTILKIREIWLKNSQTSTTSGINAFFSILRFSGISATGTLLTPQSYDTIDSVLPNITASTGATVTGESSIPIARSIQVTDEIIANNPNNTAVILAIQNSSPLWKRHDSKEKAIILRSNQGLHVKQTVNSTNGTFDLTIVYTQEILP